METIEIMMVWATPYDEEQARRMLQTKPSIISQENNK